MLTSIIAFLSQSWFGQIIGLVITWWANRKAAQDAANSAEGAAETAHQNDGAQSVNDRTSSDAQNQALDDLEKQLDTTPPVVIEKPTGGK